MSHGSDESEMDFQESSSQTQSNFEQPYQGEVNNHTQQLFSKEDVEKICFQIREETYSQIRKEMHFQISKIREEMHSQIREEMHSQIREQMHSQIREQLNSYEQYVSSRFQEINNKLAILETKATNFEKFMEENERKEATKQYHELEKKKQGYFYLQERASNTPNFDNLKRYEINLKEFEGTERDVSVCFYVVYHTSRFESVNFQRNKFEEFKAKCPVKPVIIALTPGTPSTAQSAPSSLKNGERVITLWFDPGSQQFLDEENHPSYSKIKELLPVFTPEQKSHFERLKKFLFG